MASGFNELEVIGNVGRDAELRDAGGNQVLSFSVAYTSPYGKKETTWFNMSLWGNRAEKLEQYVKKGTKVMVKGPVSLRMYTNKDGETKASLEVNVDKIQLLGGQTADQSAAADDDDDDVDF